MYVGVLWILFFFLDQTSLLAFFPGFLFCLFFRFRIRKESYFWKVAFVVSIIFSMFGILLIFYTWCIERERTRQGEVCARVCVCVLGGAGASSRVSVWVRRRFWERKYSNLRAVSSSRGETCCLAFEVKRIAICQQYSNYNEVFPWVFFVCFGIRSFYDFSSTFPACSFVWSFLDGLHAHWQGTLLASGPAHIKGANLLKNRFCPTGRTDIVIYETCFFDQFSIQSTGRYIYIKSICSSSLSIFLRNPLEKACFKKANSF